MVFSIYSQLAENKQKNPFAKFFQLSNSLTFAFPKMGVVLYCLFDLNKLQRILNKPK